MNKSIWLLIAIFALGGCSSNKTRDLEDCVLAMICESASYEETKRRIELEWEVTEIAYGNSRGVKSIGLMIANRTQRPGAIHSAYMDILVKDGVIKKIQGRAIGYAYLVPADCDRSIERRIPCVEMPERFIGLSKGDEADYKSTLEIISHYFSKCPVLDETCRKFLQAVHRMDRPLLFRRVKGGPHEYIYVTFGEDLVNDREHSADVMLKRNKTGQFEVVEVFVPHPS